MGKNPPHHGTAVEGAGRQPAENALENSRNEGTQASLDKFQDEIADDVEKAKSNIDSEQWDEVTNRAAEAETEYEEAIDSRADKYSDEGWEAVPEDEQQRDVEGTGETTDDRFADDVDEILRRGEPSIQRRQEERLERNDIETVSLGEKLDKDSPLRAEVQVTINSDSRLPDDASAGASLGLEEHHFDDARDAMVGNETAELPEDKQIDRAEDDPDWDPLETARDDVEGIDFDDVSPPEEEPGEPTEGDAGGGFHESMDRLVGEQAELEHNSQQVAERRNRGEAPMRATREGVEREDYRDRPWKNEDQGPATGESYVQRFVESGGDSVDTVQSPAVHQAIAERQPTGQSGGADRAVMDAAQSDDGKSPVQVAFHSGGINVSHVSDYDSSFEAIVEGETLVDDNVDPAPVMQEIGSVDGDKVIGPAGATSEQLGDTAIQNLHDAGYVRVRALENATVDDLTGVDGVGEKKAEKLIENEGKIARNLSETAKRLEDQFSHKRFESDDYRQILTHAAEKGLPVDVGATIFNDTAVQKEVPGPTPVTDLRAGEAEGRAKANKAREQKYVETHGTEDNQRFSPTGERYNYQAPITVDATVIETFEPQNPEAGEHQVAHVVDHEGNHTKATIYKDSLKEWDDEERHNSGQFRDGETDPSTGVSPNTVLKSGDSIEIKNPQVNDYGGGEGEGWDGPTLATTPDTTIKTDAGPRRESEGKVAAEMHSRGRQSSDANQSAPDKNRSLPIQSAPDYQDGKSRNLRRRERNYDGPDTTNRFADEVEEDEDDRNVDDVDADI